MEEELWNQQPRTAHCIEIYALIDQPCKTRADSRKKHAKVSCLHTTTPMLKGARPFRSEHVRRRILWYASSSRLCILHYSSGQSIKLLLHPVILYICLRKVGLMGWTSRSSVRAGLRSRLQTSAIGHSSTLYFGQIGDMLSVDWQQSHWIGSS